MPVEPETEKIVLCDATPSDLAWALNRWVSSAVKAARACLKHPSLAKEDRQVLWTDLELWAKSILDRTYLRVARIDGATVGFAVLDDDTVHYLYVREASRRKGVATRLVADIVRAPWFFSSETPAGCSLVRAIARRGGVEGKFSRGKAYRLLVSDVH